MTVSSQQALPPRFHFSQASLRDYQECPRRFELKYIEQCAWPALISEPALEAERRMLLGAAFHRLVQQHLAGLTPDQIESILIDPFSPAHGEELVEWWHNYLLTRPADLPGRRYVEYPLASTLAGRRIVAKLDLLVIQPATADYAESRATILDWKTSREIKRERLAGSLQTRVYRCLTARCGAVLNRGIPILPENIEMTYWFSEEGAQPVRFAYSEALYLEDQNFLSGLIAEIACLPAGSFSQTASQKPCERCVYRSLCDRGIHAGGLEDDEFDQLDAMDLSFDSVGEIEF